MKEQPAEPNFELRKALVSEVEKARGVVTVQCGAITLRHVHFDNVYFPHYIYGTNIKTGEPEAISLRDEALPQVTSRMEPPKLEKRERRPSMDEATRALQELVMLTGDPMLGILTKIHTPRGMSSQLILRVGAMKRGEINELLPGEREYEEQRHDLHVFYQTRNFCDLSEEQRKASFKEIDRISAIENEEERQSAARISAIFGLEPGL